MTAEEVALMTEIPTAPDRTPEEEAERQRQAGRNTRRVIRTELDIANEKIETLEAQVKEVMDWACREFHSGHKRPPWCTD